MTDYQELRRLAEQATPGPWDFDPGDKVRKARVTQSANEYGVMDAFIPGTMNRYHDAAYIAAANPATILALLSERQENQDRIAALEELEQRLRADLEELDLQWGEWDDGEDQHGDSIPPERSFKVPPPVKWFIEQARSLLQSSAARLAPPLRGSQGDSDTENGFGSRVERG